MSNTGKLVRMSRLVPDSRAVIVPFDDALINGPNGGLQNPTQRMREIMEGGANAVLGFPGLLRSYAHLYPGLPFIYNITASTTLGAHTRKAVVGSVLHALRSGADAVAVHVNISDSAEPEMLRALGQAGEECEEFGMPLMAIMYPRSSTRGRDDNYLDLKAADRTRYACLVRHAVRVGVELGADIVKTQYTGDPESFSTVVGACLGVPVVVAGGPHTSVATALKNAREAMDAGAAGVCFGRQTYDRESIGDFLRMLRDIVTNNSTPEQAMAQCDGEAAVLAAEQVRPPEQGAG